MAIKLIFAENNILISEESSFFNLTLKLLQINKSLYEGARNLDHVLVDRNLRHSIIKDINLELTESLEVNKSDFSPSLDSNMLVKFNNIEYTINLRSDIGRKIKYLLKLSSFFNNVVLIDAQWIEVIVLKE